VSDVKITIEPDFTLGQSQRKRYQLREARLDVTSPALERSILHVIRTGEPDSSIVIRYLAIFIQIGL